MDTMGKGDSKDDQVMVAVEEQLAADERTKDANIEVSSAAGEVTLSGMVGSEAAKEAAAGIAKGVSGVMLVMNELTVQSGAQRQDDSTVPRAPVFIAGNPSGLTGAGNPTTGGGQI